MSNILNDLNITEEQLKEGESSATVKAFEPIPSGVYTGILKEVFVYENQWGGSQMRYNFEITDNDGEKKILTYRSDIGDKLKGGEANKGYAGRLKQVSHATGVEIANLSMGSEVKLQSFGKDVEGKALLGMNNKKVKALVRHTDDAGKAEGESFKFSNDIQGVVAVDGTESDGTDAVEAFLEQIKKTPIFSKKSKAKAGGNSTTQGSASGTTKDVADML